MPYVTEQRDVFSPLFTYQYYFTDQDGNVSNDIVRERSDFFVVPGFQRTYTWRTGHTLNRKVDGRTSEEELSGEDMRKEVLRQGNRRSFNGSTDQGHAFWTRKQTWKVITPSLHIVSPTYPGSPAFYHYKGPVAYALHSLYPTEMRPFPLSQVEFPSHGRKMTDGRELINRTIPTAPEASLAAFLGELREGLPKVTGLILMRQHLNDRSFTKGAAGEYLNYQFGIAPFVADIKKICASLVNADKIFRQYLRDSGKAVRRKRTLLETAEASDPQFAIMRPTLPYESTTPWRDRMVNGGQAAQVNYHVVTRKKVWFSGEYQYAVADGSSYLDRAARYESLLNKLLGTRFTPDTLWQLTPWSWLIDWCLDLGTQISNAVAFSSDNLVLRYGYVMHHTSYEQIWHMSGATTSDGREIPPVEYRLLTEEKSRLQATPFGFDVAWESFDLRQLSILAALGVTRAPNIKP